MKKNICVIYGGKSCEHDISIITAIQTIENIDILSYNIFPIYIKDDDFYLCNQYKRMEIYTDFKNAKLYKVQLINKVLYQYKKNKLKPISNIDCAILANHGGSGENGSLSGLLDMNNIPYTAAGVLGSSIGMNKYIQKLLYKESGLNTIEYYYLSKYDYKSNSEKKESEILSKFPETLIVKPVNMGSSIGITIVSDKSKLKDALELAFAYDNEVLCERFVENSIEINCAAYRKKEDEIIISACETPVKADKFLSFNDKYKGSSGKGMKSLKRIILQDGEKLTIEVKKNTEKIYKLFNLKGVVRCDFIIDKDKVYINEINTIPGSLAYYLFTPYNISFTKMLTDCIEYAILQNEFNDNVITHYDSSLLSPKFKIDNLRK